MFVTVCSVICPILIQGGTLIILLHVFQASGDYPALICLFVFFRKIFDRCAAFICRVSGASSLRIIFINTNALLQRTFLCMALASAGDTTCIMVAVSIEFMVILIFLISVCGPLTYHTKQGTEKLRAVFLWVIGKEDVKEKPMTEEEKMYAISERAKKAYFVCLYSCGEILLAPWQLIFYHLFNSKHTNRAYMGFEREANGFPIINVYELYKTVLMCLIFDTLNLVLFTCGVRKKFPKFAPFKFLNILIRKYNMVLGLSVMSVAITVQCLLIIDCRIDIGVGVNKFQELLNWN